MAGAIAQERERCQFPFVLDEKPTVVPIGSAGDRSRCAQEVPYGAGRSNSERAAPLACVGKRFSAVRLSGIDRLDELGHGTNDNRGLGALVTTKKSLSLALHCTRGGIGHLASAADGARRWWF